MIYLDHNATTPLDSRVLDAMHPYLTAHWGNPSSPYRFGNEARAAVERARGRIADSLDCRPSNLVFCGSGTGANNLALRGAAHAARADGNHIVTTAVEHPSVLNTCRALAEEGFRVTFVPAAPDGSVNVSSVADSITDDTILVSVMHANNETGVVQPVKALSSLTRKRGICLHTDAVQTAGKLPLSVTDLGVDLLSFSAHKLYGPKGIAALYIREGTPLSNVTTGGAQERGLRPGTENVPAIVGFAEATALAFDRAEADARRLAALRDNMEARIIEAVPRSRINGVSAERVPNTSNIAFDSVDGESIVLGLDLRGICVSTGSACSTGDPEPSHVLQAMGLTAREAQGSIRISLGKETCEADVNALVTALRATVERLRQVSSFQ